jgi:hypothetical protein
MSYVSLKCMEISNFHTNGLYEVTSLSVNACSGVFVLCTHHLAPIFCSVKSPHTTATSCSGLDYQSFRDWTPSPSSEFWYQKPWCWLMQFLKYWCTWATWALTSPAGGGRSVGIVHSRTEATEFRWCSCQHEKISLNFVTIKASRLISLLSLFHLQHK